eukprot:SM000200S05810  [mRNA]  locus=s200:58981:61179:- [translate_table: standard]
MNHANGDLPPEAMDEDGDVEAEEAERDLEAWQRTYADDRSWEALQEDEAGLLKPVNVAAQQRERRRRFLEAPAARIRRGMIRYLYLIVDLSRAAQEMDLRPSRMAVEAASVEVFVREFFDQNPLSHVGIIVLRKGIAERLTELSGNPEAHIRELRKNLTCVGDASIQVPSSLALLLHLSACVVTLRRLLLACCTIRLDDGLTADLSSQGFLLTSLSLVFQNALDLARDSLSQIPSYGQREILMLYAALCTCDPGDVTASIKRCKESRIRCSVVGLSAELYICKVLCEKTGGRYSVAMSESHLQELVLEHAPPPPTLAEAAVASLVRMGFPQRAPEGSAALCACHSILRLGGGYTCPRCRVRVCELPTECPVCGLTLVSSPHLARSYHHLFPVPPYEEVSVTPQSLLPSQEILEEYGWPARDVRSISASIVMPISMKACTTALVVKASRLLV